MASASSTTQAQAIIASWSALNAGADDHWSTPPSTTQLEANGSLLIRDVEVQAAACRDRVDQGLQLRWRGRFGPCLPPALQRDPGGKPGAYRASGVSI